MPASHSNSERSRSGSRKQRNMEIENEKPAANENACLYIGNIDKKITDEKLREQFEQFGPLEYCFIVYEPQSAAERGSRTEIKQSRGYGFAKYLASSDAEKAYKNLNGIDINGRKLNIEFSKRPNPREKTPGRYLGKKRPSPPRHSRYRRSDSGQYKRKRQAKRSYSRSSSDVPKKRKDKKKYERSRSKDYRHRSSYSRSPRR